MDRDEGRESAGGGDYGLNAKDNFEFDRAVGYRQEGQKSMKKLLTYDINRRTYMSMARASDAQKGERLNRARSLLRQRARPPEAAERLARSCAISKRQAYRYLEQAQQLQQPVPVGDAKVSFTVKLSRRLVEDSGRMPPRPD